MKQQKQWREASTSGGWVLGSQAMCVSTTCHVGWCFLAAAMELGIDEAVPQLTWAATRPWILETGRMR